MEHLGQFSVTYGSIGAVIVLLTYFYLSSLILLTGAELNAAIQRARPQEGDACAKELPEEDQEPLTGSLTQSHGGEPQE